MYEIKSTRTTTYIHIFIHINILEYTQTMIQLRIDTHDKNDWVSFV